MNIVIDENEGETEIRMNGSMDAEGAREFKASIAIFKEKKVPSVVLNFSGVEFVGSYGLGQLLILYKNVAGNGGTVKMVNTNDNIYYLMESTKLTELFSVSRP